MKPVTVSNTDPGSLKPKFPFKPLINLTLCISGRLQLCSHYLSADWVVSYNKSTTRNSLFKDLLLLFRNLCPSAHKKPQIVHHTFFNQFGHCSLKCGVYYQQLLQQGEMSAQFLHNLMLAGDVHTDLTLQHSLENSPALLTFTNATQPWTRIHN